jgi:hypothetical protein
MIKIHSIHTDNVINSIVLTGETTYEFANNTIYPLINRFSAQRKIQDESFYSRLHDDIIKGCLMPPITLAIVDPNDLEFASIEDATTFINEKINSGYVLDGMQRLNTLKRASNADDIDLNRCIFLTIIISNKKDMLLYRMITLNNGQKPMTPRHQIEVLTQELFDFEDLNIDIQTEKERSERIIRGAFNLGDISKGYLAFLTGHVHNENNKIINEKMDEILVSRIMSNKAIVQGIQFQDILTIIDRMATGSIEARKWLQTQNNLIGFCVGIRESYDFLHHMSPEIFGQNCEKFEEAFRSINAAKVNLGKYRRELSRAFIANIEEQGQMSATELTGYFSDETS